MEKPCFLCGKKVNRDVIENEEPFCKSCSNNKVIPFIKELNDKSKLYHIIINPICVNK